MTVQGPIATASVRGTRFKFDTKTVAVQEGTVAFRGARGGVVLVSAGSSSLVRNDEKAADPIETSAIKLLPPPPVGSGLKSNREKTSPRSVNFGFVVTFAP